MTAPEVSRRRFLKTAAAAIAAPTIIPASALGRAGRPAPSNRIVMGCIGLGGMGTGDMQGFLSKHEVQVVAVCDVFAKHREAAQGMVIKHYTEKGSRRGYRGCDAYNDFRELIARDDIDAVCIATPDHWHALISIAAAKAGKDIYCEKPLALTIAEGRAVSDTVRRYGRVFQTGSQLRSTRNVRRLCELVRNGRIGRLHTIRTVLGPAPTIGPQPEMPIPEGFDYNRWLGPAPWAPYTKNRCHWNYRWIYDYSGGKITDLGAHDNDIAQWGNGTEHTGPVKIEGHCQFPMDGLWNTPETYAVEYTYANGVKLICSSGPGKTVEFEGTEGRVSSRGGPIESDPISLATSEIQPDEIHLYASDDHKQDFLNCIRTRKDPIAPVETAHRSATVCHLGNIALRLGRALDWDPQAERFVNDPEADKMLSRPMRAPWTVNS